MDLISATNSTPVNTLGDTLLTVREASSLTRSPVPTLNRHRHERVGIPFVKLGRRVFYRLSDIRAYIDANVVSTNGGRADA